MGATGPMVDHLVSLVVQFLIYPDLRRVVREHGPLPELLEKLLPSVVRTRHRGQYRCLLWTREPQEIQRVQRSTPLVYPRQPLPEALLDIRSLFAQCEIDQFLHASRARARSVRLRNDQL